MDLKAFSSQYMEKFDNFLVSSLYEYSADSNSLQEAMKYSLLSGGKRFRPLLLFAAVQLGKGNVEDAFSTAVALEWIHTYSLIHDDLPAMDDDDYRRGNLTTHRKFDEAIAILAGDALLTAAFSLILNQEKLSANERLQLTSSLAEAAGPKGMVAGQMEDIEAESKELTIQQLESIHKRKTGALIEFATFAGSVHSGVDQVVVEALHEYAEHLGLAFQIHNDLKDVVFNETETGKATGKDEELEKNTYPSILGIEKAKEKLTEEIDGAIKAITSLEDDAYSSAIDQPSISLFIELLEYVKI
ncbi:polyprenyl synthetase family protein [Jeotgalibaca sp. MA1X17-3]|uniref:polyprenyl synthetase family protein n=1 Tax=Jeotgalibaca sp. MA1X17-3 TaxID=2908211 RepID=UPI001F311F7E|nr:farnesyl diphosphate synthase [Jeotgalibaca sp. MA1X17-3]UJF14673.1 polyprenyl synthetase family protein [Jeotgalibaca sp. MA1X17-3]